MGPELEPQEVFQAAERFTIMITAAQGGASGTLAPRAYVDGRGCARPRQRFAPHRTRSSYRSDQADATYSAAQSRRYTIYETRTGSISVTEPFWNLKVDGAADPRVPVLT
jgi:hypothetical protein